MTQLLQKIFLVTAVIAFTACGKKSALNGNKLAQPTTKPNGPVIVDPVDTNPVDAEQKILGAWGTANKDLEVETKFLIQFSEDAAFIGLACKGFDDDAQASARVKVKITRQNIEFLEEAKDSQPLGDGTCEFRIEKGLVPYKITDKTLTIMFSAENQVVLERLTSLPLPN